MKPLMFLAGSMLGICVGTLIAFNRQTLYINYSHGTCSVDSAPAPAVTPEQNDLSYGDVLRGIPPCEARLANLSDTTPLSPGCQGEAQVLAWMFIREHPQMIKPLPPSKTVTVP